MLKNTRSALHVKAGRDPVQLALMNKGTARRVCTREAGFAGLCDWLLRLKHEQL